MLTDDCRHLCIDLRRGFPICDSRDDRAIIAEFRDRRPQGRPQAGRCFRRKLEARRHHTDNGVVASVDGYHVAEDVASTAKSRCHRA